MGNNCAYKTLGEVCNIRSGSTPLRSNPLFWENGTFPWFTIEDIQPDSKYIKNTNQYITELAKKSMFVYPEKTILLCCTASVGACAITDIELTSNQQFNGLVIKDKTKLIPEYLYYFCKTLRNHLLHVAGNAVINFVSKEKVSKIQIPIPSLEEQKKAISELDQINALIEIKEKQLQELEELEQTIFHEMFGDPIDNEKGWVVAAMPSLCEIIDGDRGKNYPKQEEFSNEGYCLFLNAKNVTSKGFVFKDNLFISEERDNLLRKGKLKRGDIVLTTRGTLGNIALYDESIPYCNVRINSGMVILRFKRMSANKVFFIYQFKLHLNYIKEKIASGTAQPQLPISSMNNIIMIVPPMDKQESFAKRVNIIREQMNAVSSTKKDLEELLASRMQYWFD